jgi:hypothetical protein
MPDTPTTPPVATGSTDPLALTPDQVTVMRETWVAHGLDPATFDQAASAPVEAPAQPGDTGEPVDVLSDLKTPGVSPKQAAEMAEELIRAGMDPARVAEALKADGYELAEDERTDEELEFDRAFGGTKPEAYRIDFRDRIPEGMDLTKVANANREMTTWLSNAAFPPEIGPAVLERAMDVGQRYANSSEPMRELWRREQQATFVKMAGSAERATELIDLAAVVLARGGDAFSDALARSGALDDVGVLMHLAHQGERLAARGAK